MTSLSKRAAGVWLIMTLALAPHSGAADELRIYAAGSLTAAFTEMVKAFPVPPGSIAPPLLVLLRRLAALCPQVGL